jgi:hypothetical protein
LSGSSGTAGTSGTFGTSGTSGTSGVSGSSGTAGTSGTFGTSGTSGLTGSSGSSGTSGSSGSSGAVGASGSSGLTGSSGSSGTAGTSGISGSSGLTNVLAYEDFYLHSATSSLTSSVALAYKLTPALPSVAQISSSVTSMNYSPGILGRWITSPLNSVLIPAGTWTLNIYSMVDQWAAYQSNIDIYVKTISAVGVTSSLLFQPSVGISQTSSFGVPSLCTATYTEPAFSCNVGDSILIEFNGNTSSRYTSRTITMYYEGSSYPSAITMPWMGLTQGSAGSSGTSGAQGATGTGTISNVTLKKYNLL